MNKEERKITDSLTDGQGEQWPLKSEQEKEDRGATGQSPWKLWS